MGIEKRLAEINDRKVEIRSMLEGNDEVNLDEVKTELEGLEVEEAELRSKIKMLEGIKTGETQTRTIEKTEPVAKTPDKRDADTTSTDSLEYRKAFMAYALRGEKTEVLTRATTFTADIGAVIPNTILDRIIEKMTAYGMIYSRVTKTNVKGGMSIPTSGAKPVATWVAEGTVADKQKKLVGKITFAYWKLQCRVAVTLEADTVSLDIFESTIVNNVYEAMVVGIEKSVISGSGSEQPLGIVNDTRITANQKIPIAADDIGVLSTWTDVVSKIPLSYEAKVAMIMTKVDYEKYIAGMLDTGGQPVARVNYGLANRPDRRFLGYEVILVEDYLPTFTAAGTGAVFGIIADLGGYFLNSNLAITYRRYFDEETDEWIDKSTLIADGKLADTNAVLLLTKAA